MMVRNQHRTLMTRCAAFCALTAFAAFPAMAQTQTWYLDPNHSAAQFSVRHMGISTVRGTFTKIKGEVVDSTDPSKASVTVEIDANSVDTRVEMRDKDLRSDHFFDVAKYPSITFKSKKVESAGNGKLKVTGDLTMHGVTKEAILDIDGPTAPFKDPKGTSHRGVSGSTTISRSEFGVNGAGAMVADPIAIQLDIELVDKMPGPPMGGPPAPPRPPAM